MSTLFDSDCLVGPSNCPGFRMFSRVPRVSKGWNAVRVHLGHSVSAGQTLFTFRLLTKLDIFDVGVELEAPMSNQPYTCSSASKQVFGTSSGKSYGVPPARPGIGIVVHAIPVYGSPGSARQWPLADITVPATTKSGGMA
jgi:hypothetical protein